MASRRRLVERFAFASHAVHHHHHRLRRRPVLEVLEGRVVLSTFTVNSLGDAGIGSNDAGDLGYCIDQANADDQSNTIVFDPTVFSTSQTITLGGSRLELSDTGGTQTITGPAAGVTISGGGNSRVFEVDSGVTASLSGLTISGGLVSPSDNGGGLANYGTATLTGCTLSGSSASASYSASTSKSSGGFGGGVFNSGTANLTLTDCTVSGNSSGGALGGGNFGRLGGRYGGDGGGLANYGTATLTGCTLSGNSAPASYLYYHGFGGFGGGVFNSGTANLTLTDCTVSGNSSGGSAREGGGGGLANYGTATLTGCTLSDNYAPSYHGYNNGLSGFGGGVFNSGTANLTLSGCTVSGNSAIGSGGGVFNSGTANLTLTDCALSGNSAYDGGGVLSGGTADLTDCAISGNSAVTLGGGLSNGGMATLTGCTLSGNNAGYGGGLANEIATSNLTDCTVSGNSSEFGGGVFNYIGTANLTNCTVSGNDASGGGGGLANYNDENIPAGPATLTDTIVAGNTSLSGAGDIGGTNVSGSDNLIGTGGSGGLANGVDSNIVGVATPLLAPLGNYGGPTQTMALLPGSPALGAGIAVTGVTTDQRGEPLDSPEPDIGAFQSQGFTLTPAAGSTPQSAATGTPFAVPLAVTVAANNPVEPVVGGVLTFTAPTSGPSVNLSATTATIGHNGVASVTATANTSAGSYTVTASAGGNATTDFDLTNTTGTLISLAFSGISDQTILYGTTSLTISGALANGSQAPAGETVAVTLGGVQQSATIGSGGAFSTTFNTAGLTVAGPPYTITYAYASDGTFASASTTSTLTVNPATPIIFTVDSLGDAGIGSNDAGDLRYCINQANADDQSNQIVFDPSVFGTPQTITLSGRELELKGTLGTQTITGPAAGVTISGGGNSRVLQVDPGVTASISGLTISGGSAAGIGGGLVNYGTATLTDCTLSGNTCVNSGVVDAHCDGGGVFNGQTAPNYYGKSYGAANLTLTDCTLSGNSAYLGGGGVSNSGTATLTDCTLSGNSAGLEGGGVYNAAGTANLTLTDCTLSGNSSFDGGGGVANVGGTITLNDCTVSGNSQGSSQGSGGGGVYNFSGTATLTDCTISGNSAYGGGGMWNGGTAYLTDTIVAGNTDPSGSSDIAGSDVSGSDNLIGTGGLGGLVSGVDGNIVLTSLADLGLAPLGNNGGPTQTMALLPGSAAIGAGVIADYPGTTTPITTDQRGDPLDSPNPDIGAFQTQGSTLTPLTFSGISNPSITYGTSSVTISGTLANGSQAPVGETVAVTLGGIQQSATIGSGGAFSTTFDTTGLTVADSPDTITYAYTSDGTFASAGTTSTLTVKPATLTITAGPETKVYGTADPALAYTAGGFQFHDTAGSVLTGALDRAQAGTLAGEQAGGYAISQGTLAANRNYTIRFTGNSLTIIPAPLTVTAQAQTKVYGTADPTLTDTATGFVDTTVDGVTIDDAAATALTGHLARTAGETVSGGPYAITQGTLGASNYTLTFTGSTLTITPAPLTVAANPQTTAYGTADPALTDTATGFIKTTVDGVTIDDTAATVLSGALARAQSGTLAGEQVGDYAIRQGTLAADNDYTMTFTGGTLSITPAILTVAANPQTKVYGAADPALTDTVAGLVDATVDGVAIDDTAATVLTGQVARTPGETVSGGPYAITQGTLAADSDYTIRFTGGSLSITPATLTVTAEPETKVFGLADPTLAYTSSGFQFSDTAATVLAGSLARASGETVSGGPYAIGRGTLESNSNYTIHFIGSSLSVTPATPAVTVSDPGGTYTGAPIAAMANVTGVNGTAARSLEGVTPTLTYYAGTGTSGTDLGSAAPSAAGTYTGVASFPGSADYAAAHTEPVTFAIAPARATIALSSSSASPVYGQAVTFVATVSSSAGTPSGMVTFFDGATPLDTVPLDGSGQAAVTISTLSLGSHAITVSYNGGTDFLGVTSGTAAESVSQSTTAIVLVPHAVLKEKKNLSAIGLTAEIVPVAPGRGVPTGQVIFEFVKKHRKKVTVNTLGTAELSGGRATLTFKPNQVLNEPLTIVYSGDSDFLASMMSPPKLTKSRIASSGT